MKKRLTLLKFAILTCIAPSFQKTFSVNKCRAKPDAQTIHSKAIHTAVDAFEQTTVCQVAQLEQAGQLKQTNTAEATIFNVLLKMTMQLPGQGIVFTKIEW